MNNSSLKELEQKIAAANIPGNFLSGE